MRQAMPDDDVQDATNGGGAASVAPTFDASDPAVQAFVQSAIDSATKDIRSEIKGFRDNNIALKKEVEGYKSIGMNPDDLKRLVENINKNEEAKLIADGKFEDVLQMRVEPLRRDYETRLDAATKRQDELSERVHLLEEENYELRVTQQVTAHIPPDVWDGAQRIFIDEARKVWKRDDDGNMVPRRDNGTRWISKDGKHDIGFEEWIATFRDTMPFLFRTPSGSPARGGNAAGTSTAWDNLYAEAKLQAYRDSKGLR